MKAKLIVPMLVTLGLSQNVFAGAASITFSQYRILLDKNIQSSELTLRNTEANNAECLLDLAHFNFEINNNIVAQKSADTTYMPANKLLRYSPRSVTIPAFGSQKVKISYRHRANLEPGEYVSFFQIGCSEKNDNLVKGQPNIGAKINYNLPVQVRIGEATATSAFEVVSISPKGEGAQLVLKQTRQGNRSVVGDIKIIEKSSGDVLGLVRNFSLYRPAEYAEHIVNLEKKPQSDVLVEFAEASNVYMPITQTFEIPQSRF
ncbi:hypothetical protein [Pseudoalteromonas tunicata]|uniref:hypothetical protein n=1 Tax=Pseudoalteromonas tunicata TaxID=314281 RepID=UPI00273ED44A|nr:hypothetical protein [Pseudoalteromonas tunicata]MDP4985614.1 hypothetical protein [Pseudoalteromonas tunicata]MDP5212490.1 hypothetical protein [Pseudoalteromonas tunicata]